MFAWTISSSLMLFINGLTDTRYVSYGIKTSSRSFSMTFGTFLSPLISWRMLFRVDVISKQLQVTDLETLAAA